MAQGPGVTRDRPALDRELDRLSAMLSPWLAHLRHPAQFWPQFDALVGRIRGQARAEDRGHVDARLLRMLAGHPELRRGLPARRASAGRRRP